MNCFTIKRFIFEKKNKFTLIIYESLSRKQIYVAKEFRFYLLPIDTFFPDSRTCLYPFKLKKIKIKCSMWRIMQMHFTKNTATNFYASIGELRP